MFHPICHRYNDRDKPLTLHAKKERRSRDLRSLWGGDKEQ